MRSKAGCFIISADGICSSASSGLLNTEPSSQQLPVRFPVGDPESEEPLGFGSTCGRSRKQSMTGRPPWVANHLHENLTDSHHSGAAIDLCSFLASRCQ